MAPHKRRPTETFIAEARARVAPLRAEGLSLNKIAKRLGVSTGSVSRWAKADGVSFDRSQVREAVAARVVDMAALRVVEAEASILDARRLRERAWVPYQVVVSGSKGAEVVSLDLPPLADVRNAYAAYGIVIDKHLALARFDADPNAGASAVDGWLMHMTGA